MSGAIKPDPAAKRVSAAQRAQLVFRKSPQVLKTVNLRADRGSRRGGT